MLLFRRPGRDDGWSPTVLGLAKRDLLREVLLIFGTLCSNTIRLFALRFVNSEKQNAGEVGVRLARCLEEGLYG